MKKTTLILALLTSLSASNSFAAERDNSFPFVVDSFEVIMLFAVVTIIIAVVVLTRTILSMTQLLKEKGAE